MPPPDRGGRTTCGLRARCSWPWPRALCLDPLKLVSDNAATMSELPEIKLPVVLPHPTNIQLKRTRQGFCWGCGASLKEAHSDACEFDGKRLRRDAPARVAIVVRAAAGRGCPPAVVTLHVFAPHTDTLQQLTSGTE